jgi:uncharacterized protein YndB with AHSA1/START domain
MKKTILFNFHVDKEKRQIKVERSFNAPLPLVWKAWTDPEILDRWWGPKPWRAATKSMNFSVGGHWLYAMVGPEGEKHWGKVTYLSISPEEFFTANDSFCDEQGVINPDFPENQWENKFTSNGETTKVAVTLNFDTLADLEKIIEMGFKEGFTMGLNQLDEWLETYQSNNR